MDQYWIIWKKKAYFESTAKSIALFNQVCGLKIVNEKNFRENMF